MQQAKPLSLTDLVRDPDAVVKDFTEIPDGDDVEYVKDYGIGIDCHSKFIEICVRYRNGCLIQKAQGHFSTDWNNLIAAHDWCIKVLKTGSTIFPGDAFSIPWGLPAISCSSPKFPGSIK